MKGAEMKGAEMKKIGNLIRRFIADEQGLETVEYVMLAAFMLLIVSVGIGVFMSALESKYTELANELGAGGGAGGGSGIGSGK